MGIFMNVYNVRGKECLQDRTALGPLSISCQFYKKGEKERKDNSHSRVDLTMAISLKNKLTYIKLNTRLVCSFIIVKATIHIFNYYI